MLIEAYKYVRNYETTYIDYYLRLTNILQVNYICV